MHIPDGFLTKEVFAPLIVVSAAGIALAGRAASKKFNDRMIPLVGVMSAFVFAAQMINFPVGAGVSGHFVGTALLAAVFGPAVAVLAMTSVLIVQALLFADGGIAALGANVFNMALVSSLTAWAVYSVCRKIAGDKIAIFAAGLFSTTAAAVFCAGELALSGTAPAAPLVTTMAATHIVIGIFEGVVSAAAFSIVKKLAPEAMK